MMRPKVFHCPVPWFTLILIVAAEEFGDKKAKANPTDNFFDDFNCNLKVNVSWPNQ